MIGKRYHHFRFHIFHQKQKRYDIIGNENGIGVTVISEMKIYDWDNIDNDRNLSKQYIENDKYVKL